MVNKKETNLEGVKAMARTLLYTEINRTAYSPMIVQHPFTNTGITNIPYVQVFRLLLWYVIYHFLQ